MLRRLGVRGKILATLGVPVLVLIVAFGLLSLRAFETFGAARLNSSFVSLISSQERFLAAVQSERDAALHLAAVGPDATEELTASLASALSVTDNARAAFNRAMAEIDLDSVGDDARLAFAAADAARGDGTFAQARQALEEAPLHGATIQARYTAIIGPQLDLADVLANVLADRRLATYVGAYANLNRLHDAVRLEGVLGINQIALNDAGTLTEGQQRTMALFANNVGAIQTNTETSLGQITGTAAGLTVPTDNFYYTQVHNAFRDGNVLSAGVSAVRVWERSFGEQVAAIAEVRGTLSDAMDDVAGDAEGAALRELVVTLAAILVALALTLLVATLVARTIADPLRALRDAAGKIRDELPRLVDQVAEPGKGPDVVVEPIQVTSRDEVGQLATAFNEVNEVTLRVAREQALLRGSIAEMFINVARRDQVLLNRQLVFLDELERSEEDPGTLSNLFRLDHLATRMRRNAESLLVLAGIDSGRRVRQPMPLSDVVRTASSEIEQYDRVQLDLGSDPLMLGHNALPAAHLLAELLENATVFSEPGTPIAVSVTEDARWINVVIQDEGLGMSPEEIDEANEKAATYSASEIVGAQRLGLYVVGRLSYKLGATVRFMSAPEGSGTLVRVSFARALFLADSEVPLDAPVDLLSKKTQDATEAWVGPEVTTGSTPLVSRHDGLPEPEAPVAVPVDLDALTDGATALGMPRRRTNVDADGSTAPSVRLSGGLDESAIVLPETVAPALPAEFAATAEEWTPPQAEIATASLPTRGGGLPTRARTGVPAAVEPAPVPMSAAEAAEAVPARAAVFSSFRTRRSIEFLEQAHAAGGAAPAGDVAAAAAAPEPEPEMVVPEIVRDEDVPGLASAAETDDAAWAPSVPAAAEAPAAEAPVAAEGWAPTAPSAPAADGWAPTAPSAPVADGWASTAPVAPEHQPAHAAPAHAAPEPSTGAGWTTPSETDEALYERLRSLGAHVGSIASAAELPEDDAPVRRGRYARYVDDELPAASTPELPAEPEPFVLEPVDLEVRGDVQVPGLDDEVTVVPDLDPSDDDPLDAPVLEDVAPADEVAPPDGYAPAPPDGDAPAPAADGSPAWEAPVADPGPFAPYAVTPGGTELPSFSDVVGQPAAPAGSGAQERKGLFGRLFKRRGAEPTVTETPAPAAAPAAAPSWDAAPQDAWAPPAAPVAPPAAEDLPDIPSTGFSYRAPQIQHSFSAPETYEPEVEAAPSAPETFTPLGEDSWGGPTLAFDADLTARLALQAGIQEQALSELSQLSSYRPNQDLSAKGQGLTKRVRAEVPAEAEQGKPEETKIARDAVELRSRLSSFMTATTRGRQEGVGDEPGSSTVPATAPQSF